MTREERPPRPQGLRPFGQSFDQHVTSATPPARSHSSARVAPSMSVGVELRGAVCVEMVRDIVATNRTNEGVAAGAGPRRVLMGSCLQEIPHYSGCCTTEHTTGPLLMRLLYAYLRTYWRLVALALALAAINQVFSLLDPLILRHVIDEYA